jgi:Tfp pilus assembly PilM family ATPase/Tfp pilus assembly protein PilN
MVRMVELPASLSGNDLDSAVRHLAGDLLPVGLDQLVVDYRCIGKAPEGSGPRQQRVLMAAARVDGIERLNRALAGAHLKAERIQLSGLAMLRALEHPPMGGDAILYVQAGALTNVVIAEGGEPLLVRAASIGSESIAAGLAERTGITHEEARGHIAAMGVSPASGSSGMTPELEEAVSQQVREGLRRVIAEIQSSRGFYSARPDARPIGGVVLTGAMTTWPGVSEMLRDELNVPVLPAGRDGWPDLGTVSVPPERLDVAVGLALASNSERPDLRPVTAKNGGHRAIEAAPNARVAQVLCGVAALVAVAVVYLVIVSNQVSSGKERIATISGQVVQAEQQAAKLEPYATFDKTTKDRRAAVTKIAGARFNWDRSLTELSRVAPGDVWLTSARGTLTPTTAVDGGGAGGSSLRGALPGPALELSGCSDLEKNVPKYMDRLYSMSGVSEVGFIRTERPAKTAAASAGAGSAAGPTSTCVGAHDPSVFSLVTYFKQSSALAALASDTTTTPGAAPTPAVTTPAATTPAPANQTAPTAAGGTK